LDFPTPPPVAWQPLTPRGVAAFSRARFGRLFLLQILVSLLTAAAVVWFLNVAWVPVALQAILQLPDSGRIADRQLSTPYESPLPLAHNRFIAFFADPNGVSDAVIASDLRITFHRRVIRFNSLFGTLAVNYPAGDEVPFNRIELLSGWGAWQPMLLVMIVASILVSLFACWVVLATFYSPVAWMVAFLKDRQLTLLGSWKLSAAALLPAALLVAVTLVFYGLGLIDLLAFLVVWVMHFVAGMTMLFFSILALDKVESVTRVRPNPFDNPTTPAEAPPQNPFSAPSTDRGPVDRK